MYNESSLWVLYMGGSNWFILLGGYMGFSPGLRALGDGDPACAHTGHMEYPDNLGCVTNMTGSKEWKGGGDPPIHSQHAIPGTHPDFQLWYLQPLCNWYQYVRHCRFGTVLSSSSSSSESCVVMRVDWEGGSGRQFVVWMKLSCIRS